MRHLLSMLALTVLLGGCATDIPPSSPLADGALTAAPAGWTGYCSRHTEDSGCRS